MAFITVLLQTVGGYARLATVLIESDDFLFKVQYISGSCLNTIMFIQFFMYWNNTIKANKIADDKKKK